MRVNGKSKPAGTANGHNGFPSRSSSFLSDRIAPATYPTQSLQFLRNVPRQSGVTSTAPQAQLKLSVLVVGAGLGGLATAIALARNGHSVTVLEQASQLAEVGAGIQVPPNSARLLKRWGVMKHLESRAVAPELIRFLRWESGKEIGLTRLSPEFEQNFNTPYYVAHRADLHTALHTRAVELGVTLHLKSLVVRYSAESATVTLANGKIFDADLVVAADGIRSAARAIVDPKLDGEPRQTGFAVYRATVPVEKMRLYPELDWVLQNHNLNVWIGEGRHVMTYAISGGNTFNMVLSHRDYTEPSTWKSDNILNDIKDEFSGWDPQLLTIIGLIETSVKWPLMSGSRLESWTAPSSKLVILGDAAHAMVPYMSQGAAMAVEDSAALAVALAKIETLSELPSALRIFQNERIERTGQMQEASMVNGLIWHFPDGPEQEARDAAMRAEVEGRPFIMSANQWSDPTTQCWAYGYDAEEAIERAWRAAMQVEKCRKHL